jgi:hypothetical protein
MKKINKIYSVLALASGALALTSCNDFLDTLPDNRAEINTEAKVTALLVSAYPDHDYQLLTEYSSDNVDDYGTKNPYTDRFLDQVFHWEDVTEDDNEGVEDVWESYYKSIASANQALESIESMGGPSTTVLREAKGEALLCRAFNHYILVNLFCLEYDPNDDKSVGIPYMEKPETTLKPMYSRGTVKEVYAKIEKDLKEGLALVGESYYTVPKYHFNKKAAYAFAARFYLSYQKWDKVIEYANQVLGSNPATMLRDWQHQSTMTQTFEAITQHYIDATLNTNLLLLTGYSSMGLAMGPYYVNKRYAHGSYISTNETANALNIWGTEGYYMLIKRYAATNLNCHVFWKNPYIFEYTDPVAGIGYRHSVFSELNADETLLYRAEAYVMQNENEKACADLTVWLQNINRTAKTKDFKLTADTITNFYSKIAYSYDDDKKMASTVKKHLKPKFDIGAENGTKECMIQCVLGFRRIQTLQEGKRWFDVKRYGIEVPRRLMNAAGNPESVTDWLTVDDPRRAMQLPKKVIDAGLPANPRKK